MSTTARKEKRVQCLVKKAQTASKSVPIPGPAPVCGRDVQRSRFLEFYSS